MEFPTVTEEALRSQGGKSKKVKEIKSTHRIIYEKAKSIHTSILAKLVNTFHPDEDTQQSLPYRCPRCKKLLHIILTKKTCI